MPNDASLRQHLISLLTKGNAHATFDAAIKNLPEELRGKRPKGAEYSPWQLLEHLRIAQCGHSGVFAGCEAQIAEVAR